MSRALRRTYVAGTQAYDAELKLVEGVLSGTLDDGDGEQAVEAVIRRLGTEVVRIDRDGTSVRATIVRDGDKAWVAIDGRTYELEIEEAGAGAAHHAGEDDFATSPMTGTLVKVSVEAGQAVAEGGELFVVEAMKMEYVVRAPRAITVGEVSGRVGEQVEQGRIVVTFEEEA